MPNISFELTDLKECETVIAIIAANYQGLIDAHATRKEAVEKPAPKKKVTKKEEPPAHTDADVPHDVEVPEQKVVEAPEEVKVEEPSSDTEPKTLKDVQDLITTNLGIIKKSTDPESFQGVRQSIITMLNDKFGVTSSADLELDQMDDAYDALSEYFANQGA